MKTTKTLIRSLVTAIVVSSLTLSAQASQTYVGNGATGFGGPVGTGSVTISDSLSGMTITLNRGAGVLNDDLVLYLDTQPGGFNDTSAFMDNADGGRTAISGYNAGNPSQTVAYFTSGFGADYAISIENSFIGVFGLVAGGNGSLNFLFGQGQSGINTDPSYSITISAAQMAQIGLTAGSGQTFDLVGSLDSTSAYRSDETIGTSVTVPGDGAGNAGFSNPQTFITSDIYTLAIPEPSALALFGLSGLAAMRLFRSRK